MRTLRKQEEFDRTIAEGARRSGNSMVLFILERSGESAAGFSAGRKLGGAVRRNRARRLLREIARLHWDLVPDGHGIVLIARQGIFRNSFQDMEIEFSRLLDSAIGSGGRRLMQRG
ncbi:MAG: ribonuclease P protein component [bacterium]|nr:ribonuclease P protein component [bacterium]